MAPACAYPHCNPRGGVPAWIHIMARTPERERSLTGDAHQDVIRCGRYHFSMSAYDA